MKWIGSPNYDTNRKPIDRVVIHWFGAGNQAGADATFQKPSGTSAHYSVEDTTVHQYVKEEHVAYHAGNYAMNQRSIGIEHSATPDRPATEATYQTAGKLLGEICARHNIPLDREHIIKHSEVPRATQCCGTIDIDKLISIAKGGGMADTVESLKAQLAESEKNKNSLQSQVDGWVRDTQNGKYVLGADVELKVQDAYDRGFGAGRASVKPESQVEIDKWEVNGLTISTVENGKTISLNYKLK